MSKVSEYTKKKNKKKDIRVVREMARFLNSYEGI